MNRIVENETGPGGHMDINRNLLVKITPDMQAHFNRLKSPRKDSFNYERWIYNRNFKSPIQLKLLHEDNGSSWFYHNHENVWKTT